MGKSNWTPIPLHNNDLHKFVSQIERQEAEVRLEYIERMAAAYYQETQIPPSECELVEQRMRDGSVVYSFRKKGSV